MSALSTEVQPELPSVGIYEDAVMEQGNQRTARLTHSKLQQGLASEQDPAWRDRHHMLQQIILCELFC